ncbi:MAG: transcription elongation factor GreA [Candidatus Pacebacteria bacterium CG10_big_fil_rev_8_21_14_0_10_42_12]|nr:transcription elongation factor GreA [Candidatus Paceibacterota bacterium]PIR62785.1 MAG: transcription elongation factor GreA [Candidatus Pacebacteria bacterium CG10_big_fil_rev_8_21_14_0_10_42_12]
MIKISNPIPFTKKAHDKLLSDRSRLRKERVEVMKRLKVAREMGDLSENGAYTYAKFELGSIGRQLRRINQLLDDAVVVEERVHVIVEFGASVTLSGPKGNKTYLIVSEHESDLENNKLAMTSPIGSAIMEKRAGDEVSVVTPRGEVKYKITAIS